MRFLAALRFLTIIPLPRRWPFRPEGVGGSVTYFPVVGLLIGLLLVGENWVLELLLPAAVVKGLLVVSLVVISGALHLDGFIDTCDGLASGKTAEERWRIMHDSRVGAFGVVGVFLLLLVKYLLLNSLAGSSLGITLLLMPMVSRWAMVYTIFVFPYARPAGLGRVFKQEVSWQKFAIATAITLGVTMVGLAYLAGTPFFYLAGLVIILAVWLIVTGVATYLKKKFNGLTGDTYGAVNEVAEVGVLILILLLAHNRWLVA